MNTPKGTVVFTTVGRQNYGFDVYSVKIPSDLNSSSFSNSDEHRHTDGVSLNFNAQFTEDNQAIVYISERSSFPSIYLSKIHNTKPEKLPFIPESLFHDRPIIKNNRLYFISAHEKPDKLFKSWNALYTMSLNQSRREITRLTPYDVADFSPAVSLSGKYIAVASYGSRLWGTEFEDLKTDIVVFKESEPDKRIVVCQRGGWPTWSGDSTIYFHRKADDGFWSIFQVKLPEDFSQFTCSDPIRITPPGVNCITPCAMHDGKRIAVATRRRNKTYRHIEIFDLASGIFHPVTELINPSFHHYNPFVSQDSMFIGYHRFRGESAAHGETTIPNLEPVKSHINDLRMVRINGSFPSFSPEGDFISYNAGLSQGLHIVKSDGSKRWTLITRDRVAFHTAWSPTEKNVIYTTLGPVFASMESTVQIARVSFDLSDLKPDGDQIIQCDVKILTKQDSGNNAFPACSPDGKYLVFRSGRSGHKNLYIMDAVDGEFKGGIRQLTNGPWTDTMPSWSPKGDLIAFSSNRHNPGHSNPFSIYVIKPDGSDLRRIHLEGSERLTQADREWMERINHVSFTNDGEWFLFTANLGSVTAEAVSLPRQIQPYGDVYMARLDGSGLQRLTWNGYENGTQVFYPDQKRRYLQTVKNKMHVLICSLMKILGLYLIMMKMSKKIDVEDRDKLAGQFNDVTWLRIEK
ncbi:uncharacterized protein LOC126660500 [Mercurialis annua]|uniref:uncharacterized protein LOC126660500 n=1 Tax=Mercurialis annua TaxID=3986 RepID=UPI002160A2DC|nr:uncharacterized protein LOC126660500 [Mercurialis annua]